MQPDDKSPPFLFSVFNKVKKDNKWWAAGVVFALTNLIKDEIVRDKQFDIFPISLGNCQEINNTPGFRKNV